MCVVMIMSKWVHDAPAINKDKVADQFRTARFPLLLEKVFLTSAAFPISARDKFAPKDIINT